MAQDWHVVCVDKASFNHAARWRCDEQNPAKVAQLRDPTSPTRDYAYEATTDKASIHGARSSTPTGRLIAKQVKTYLTPIELPGDQLDLVPGRPASGLGRAPVKTPVGTLGFVTSKDAWMPDVHRQARRSSTSTCSCSRSSSWATWCCADGQCGRPTCCKAAGYNDAAAAARRSRRWCCPSSTGNVFDFSADAPVADRRQAARAAARAAATSSASRGVPGSSA